MSKDYWYVLIPVHLVTSVGWGGIFYVMCKSGVDVAAILQYWGTSEQYVEKISQSPYGYAALAYACYKIATPIRYGHNNQICTSLCMYMSNYYIHEP